MKMSIAGAGYVGLSMATLLAQHHSIEEVKLFANTFLTLRVSYFNELDTYAEMKGLDTRERLSVV